jgi:hypothetical protein
METFWENIGNIFMEVALLLPSFPTSWNGHFWSYPSFHCINSFERTFWYLQFFQKTDLKSLIFALARGTSSPSLLEQKFFIRFLEELKTPKRHFEINWPLPVPKKCFTFWHHCWWEFLEFKITNLFFDIIHGGLYRWRENSFPFFLYQKLKEIFIRYSRIILTASKDMLISKIWREWLKNSARHAHLNFEV